MRAQIAGYIDVLKKKLSAAEAFLASLDDADLRAVESGPAAIPTQGSLSVRTHVMPVELEGYGKNVNAVRSVIPPEKSFDVNVVMAALIAEGKGLERDKISQALSKMARSGELEVVSAGAGRRASKYKLARKPMPPVLAFQQ